LLRPLLHLLSPGESGRWRLAPLNIALLSIISALFLTLLGLYGIDLARSDQPHALKHLDPITARQLAFIAIALLSAAAITVPHFRLLGALAWPALGMCIALLVFLLIPIVPEWIVKPVNGARAWINLGVIRLQPSELTKVAFVLVLARYLRFRSTHRRFLGLVPVAAIAFVPVALIMLQPDLGTVLLFVPALFAILVAAGARLRHLTIIVLAAALAAPAAYPLLQPHQKARIAGLLQQARGDDTGEFDINYQGTRAQTLAGAGQPAGTTDRHARALVHFNYLPERHTDMVYSVLVTRFGFLGGLAILLLYTLWLAGALLTAAHCKDPFGRLVCVGLAAFVLAQVVVNIGMNLGLLPIIGITLPFMSYGGSSLLTVWIMTGIIYNIALRRPIPPFRPSFEYPD